MPKFFTVLGTISLAFTGSICQAAEPYCSTGSPAYLEGEINNNAVAFPAGLTVTSGVAELKLSTKTGARNLTCALSGIPNTDTALSHNFDHRIVCDDVEQSELSFNTRFTGAEPLDPKLKKKLCRGDVLSYFQEKSEPDSSEASKGVFRGVYEGELLVDGCVNSGSDIVPDIHINMVVDGYVCLEN